MMFSALRKIALFVSIVLTLSGCSQTSDLLNPTPKLKPVGSGLVQPVSLQMPGYLKMAGAQENRDVFAGSAADFFRDRRARRVGDVVTVMISIDDQASLNSNISRSRQSKIGSSLDLALEWVGLGYEGNGGLDTSTDSSANGRGSVTRSERIELSVAALVTKRLANGYLVISGNQEVRINNEIRELSVAGIVDPLHVTSENTISYDKIAEARISYGGRGRVADVQAPPIGLRLFDKITPF